MGDAGRAALQFTFLERLLHKPCPSSLVPVVRIERTTYRLPGGSLLALALFLYRHRKTIARYVSVRRDAASVPDYRLP
jgi:hypothetical protein